MPIPSTGSSGQLLTSNQITDSIHSSIDQINSSQIDISNSIYDLASAYSSGSLAPSTLTDISTTILDLNTLSDSLNSTSQVLNSTLTTYNTSSQQLNSGNRLLSSLSSKTLDNIISQNRQLDQSVKNKRRMTEINNYYSNMNTHINEILRNIIILVIIVILFTILSKKGIIPANISTIVTIILVTSIVIYIIYSVYDINIRDKFNFNEYIIPFDDKAMHLEASGNTSRFTDIRNTLGKDILGGIDSIQNLTGTCLGGNCCEPGTIYDINRSACILDCSLTNPGTKYTVSINPRTGKSEGKCA